MSNILRTLRREAGTWKRNKARWRPTRSREERQFMRAESLKAMKPGLVRSFVARLLRGSMSMGRAPRGGGR